MNIRILLAALCIFVPTTSFATHIKGFGAYDFEYLVNGEVLPGSFSFKVKSPEFDLAPDDEIYTIPTNWDVLSITFSIPGISLDIEEIGTCDCYFADNSLTWEELQYYPDPDYLLMDFSDGLLAINYYDGEAGFQVGNYFGSTEGEDWSIYQGSASFEVPVPATAALFGIGLAGLGFQRRKKV